MTKLTLIVKVESNDDLKAYVDAEKNQLKIETLYDSVFRPHIKYGKTDEEVEHYEKVWLKCYEHFKED